MRSWISVPAASAASSGLHSTVSSGHDRSPLRGPSLDLRRAPLGLSARDDRVPARADEDRIGERRCGDRIGNRSGRRAARRPRSNLYAVEPDDAMQAHVDARLAGHTVCRSSSSAASPHRPPLPDGPIRPSIPFATKLLGSFVRSRSQAKSGSSSRPSWSSARCAGRSRGRPNFRIVLSWIRTLIVTASPNHTTTAQTRDRPVLRADGLATPS